ncbi:hypothetical protein HMPREF0063_12160 [Aeromicrobium marinum DSM 15272]|uniref:PQQ enzyme repeat protein n=1 Tax=Aeromicrobium marinum DSM 15272 TaxID=585531 RepID=E2SCJ8_9ACTN|nr:hypothetical protein [Aeromicrobium marinum]EFQ82951.1 hypothetical protein HMPREF0063_12160 [Aeromicrobium marinum DSM 15272]
MLKLIALVLFLVPALAPVAQDPAPATPVNAPAPGGTPLDVMFVGNNWAGTADVVDARTFEKLRTIDVVPDRQQRLNEILLDPVAAGFLLAIRGLVGQGNDQFVDDMFSTPDGTLLAVSRPSLADVVGIDLATEEIVWRFPMEGYRTDHMGVSPDGSRLLVSDSTANKVHELDLRTGEKLREFASGDTPHENEYLEDGSKIFHASIGRVYVPGNLNPLGGADAIVKGSQVFQIVDNETFEIEKRWDMGAELDEAGYPGFSSAVRPMAIAPDERYVYLQVSYHHGFVEFDTAGEGRVTRVALLPQSEKAKSIPESRYVLNSAHHGLAMNEAGTTLCAAGTMSDYAAIVDRESFRHTIIPVGDKPYWSTTGVDGDTCWVSVSGTDQVVVIDYDSAEVIAEIPVGDHPQRVRAGTVSEGILSTW